MQLKTSSIHMSIDSTLKLSRADCYLDLSMIDVLIKPRWSVTCDTFMHLHYLVKCIRVLSIFDVL